MKKVGNVFKPRYKIAHLAKSKVWAYKNSRLRRFYTTRGRRLQRGSLFRRFVLVSTTRKWTEARRRIRPIRRRLGTGLWGGGRTLLGRPRKNTYRDRFYRKQQLRAFYGKRKEARLRSYLTNSRKHGVLKNVHSGLESRLDRILFRRRLRPTIYTCHQFIRHQGICVNGGLEHSPHAQIRLGDTISLVPVRSNSALQNANHREVFTLGLYSRSAPRLESQLQDYRERNLDKWRATYWDRFCRLYYRRWGLHTFRRRLIGNLKKKVVIFTLRASDQRAFTSDRSNPKKKLHSFKIVKRILSKRNVKYGLKRSVKKLVKGTLKEFERAKLKHYLKLGLAVRLRKSLLPYLPSLPSSVFKRPQKRASAATSLYAVNDKPKLSFIKKRSGKRKRRRRFRRSRRIKLARIRKFPRLKPVHRRFPSYLQRDLRTLRATRVHEPRPEERFYAFRGSASQVSSFYSSRGF